MGDLVAEYGTRALVKGLRKLGLDEWAEKMLRQADDAVDDLAPNPCRSFALDTMVLTRDGPVPIEDLRVGQHVLAYDEETGEIGYYPVLSIWLHKGPLIAYLTVNGEVIETTPEHPFYTADGKWVAVADCPG